MISNVETIELKYNMIVKAKARNDEWGDVVVRRLEEYFDLVAVEAKYHGTCAQKFLISSEKLKPVNESLYTKRNLAFNELCMFLDKNE